MLLWHVDCFSYWQSTKTAVRRIASAMFAAGAQGQAQATPSRKLDQARFGAVIALRLTKPCFRSAARICRHDQSTKQGGFNVLSRAIRIRHQNGGCRRIQDL